MTMKFFVLLAMVTADPGVTTHVLDTTLGLPGKVKALIFRETIYRVSK